VPQSRKGQIGKLHRSGKRWKIYGIASRVVARCSFAMLNLMVNQLGVWTISSRASFAVLRSAPALRVWALRLSVAGAAAARSNSSGHTPPRARARISYIDHLVNFIATARER
jgi:hypothetical protein